LPPYFSSTIKTRNSVVPTFSIECGASGSDQRVSPGSGRCAPARVEDDGAVSVAPNEVGRGEDVLHVRPPMRVDGRLRAGGDVRLEHSARWCSGAAVSASSSSGHVQSLTRSPA
jgi:hypothetical protein